MARFKAWKYLSDQWSALPPVSEYSTDLAGKTVIVVGASAGLGLEAARHFARMGPGRLILACRNMDKAEKAVKSVRETTGCQNVEAWFVDLAEFKTISAFVDKYQQEEGGRLDLLVMNAGVNSFDCRRTADEWELLLQTNHLGTCLLALLLLPYLKISSLSSSTSRIVIVTSDIHYVSLSLVDSEAQNPRILEKLNDRQHCTRAVMLRRYRVTKCRLINLGLGNPWFTLVGRHCTVFNVFFARALASRLPTPSSNTPGLTVTCVNPGWCKSELNREIRWTPEGCLVWILGPLLARTTEAGSRTLVWAALAGNDAGGEVHGRYTASCQVEEESDYVLSREAGEVEARVWSETIEVLTKFDSRIGGILTDHLDRV